MGNIILKPSSALEAAGAPTRIGAIMLQENPGIALASLAMRKGQQAAFAATAAEIGLALPGPGQASASAPFRALWLGPDQWLVMADLATHEDIAADLAVFGATASITEQTGGWVCLDLTGPTLADLFERLCPVDLRAMPSGGGTRTVIEHLGTYLIRLGPDQVRLFGPRSSAHALWHAVTGAARSIA